MVTVVGGICFTISSTEDSRLYRLGSFYPPADREIRYWAQNADSDQKPDSRPE